MTCLALCAETDTSASGWSRGRDAGGVQDGLSQRRAIREHGTAISPPRSFEHHCRKGLLVSPSVPSLSSGMLPRSRRLSA
jgi:hypothetical protein